MSSKDTQTIVQRHMDAFVRGDVAGLMADYADDVTFLSPLTGPIEGRAALEQLYIGLFRDSLPPSTTRVSIGPVLTSGELAIIEWEAIGTALRTQGASDTFVVREGKIVAHTGAGSFVPIG